MNMNMNREHHLAAIVAAISLYLEEEAWTEAQQRSRPAPSPWRMWSRRQLARHGLGSFPNSRWAGLANWRDPRYVMQG